MPATSAARAITEAPVQTDRRNRKTGSAQRRTGHPIEDPEYFRLTKIPTVGYLIAERAETVAALRQLFRARGFNVQRYSDDAVSKALLADSGKALSPAKRIGLAFKRLVNRSA